MRQLRWASQREVDAVVIGGGHNGLVCGAYLAKNGKKTLVLERRHVIGGAAVTEEMVPGFKFSRASYLAGLLRPAIIEELELESKHGLKYLPRNPSSFTPSRSATEPYLMLGDDAALNRASIAQFSEKDAAAFDEYEEFLAKARDLIQPLLDAPPLELSEESRGLQQLRHSASTLKQVLTVGSKNREVIVPFYELFTGSATHLLNRWFDSEVLKTTLATDAVIGALLSPSQAGSSYVLLHHVMGEAAGKKGVWSYVEGGMGAISESIASSARSHGAEIEVNQTVKRIIYEKNGAKNRVTGVELESGEIVKTKTIVSCCSPYHTFMNLLPGDECDMSVGSSEVDSVLPKDFVKHIKHTDMSCGAFKINCAVSELPEFTCYPNTNVSASGEKLPGPMHMGTAHFESTMEEIEAAYREASVGVPATRPVVEMTIPTSVDKTIAPEGKHVVQLFIQFAPYDVDPKVGSWADPAFKEAFVKRVFAIVDEFAPNFSSSIIDYDALSPLDLETVFGLPKGNIFHGALTLQQLGYARPAPGFSSHRSPMEGLYMGASGTHPGGGVMGAPGRNCARVVLGDGGKKLK